MLLDQNTIENLQKLGLTVYGARAYAVLIATGPMDAGTIAREAEIPRTKIYEVLRRLKEGKWVTIEKGRPATVTPRYPREAIEEKKQAFNSDMDQLSNELAMTYDRLMEKENPKVWLIRGMDKITSKTLEMMGKARQSVMMLGTLYSPTEVDLIKREIVRARKRGVSVRIITRPLIKYGGSTFNIAESFSAVTSDVRIAFPPYLKFVMIDDRETLIMFSRVDEDTPDLDSIIAIWIPNSPVTSYMASNFNMEWGNSRKYFKGQDTM